MSKQNLCERKIEMGDRESCITEGKADASYDMFSQFLKGIEHTGLNATTESQAETSVLNATMLPQEVCDITDVHRP